MTSINAFQPIIPAESAAGIILGSNIASLSGYIDFGKGDDEFDGSTVYELLDGTVSVGVHNSSGKIFRISANQGYKGFLFEMLRLGMPIDILSISSNWLFDDAEGGFLHQAHNGVIIMSDMEDPLSASEIRGTSILEIAVSVNNINSLDLDWKK